eukprot:jgi/Chlat1/31/ChrspC231419S00913
MTVAAPALLPLRFPTTTPTTTTTIRLAATAPPTSPRASPQSPQSMHDPMETHQGQASKVPWLFAREGASSYMRGNDGSFRTPALPSIAVFHGTRCSQPYQQEEPRYIRQVELMVPPAEVYGPSQHVQAEATPRDRLSQASGSVITLPQIQAATTGENITSFHAKLKERLKDDERLGAFTARSYRDHYQLRRSKPQASANRIPALVH